MLLDNIAPKKDLNFYNIYVVRRWEPLQRETDLPYV